LKLKYDEALSNFAFNFDLRRYIQAAAMDISVNNINVRAADAYGRDALTKNGCDLLSHVKYNDQDLLSHFEYNDQT